MSAMMNPKINQVTPDDIVEYVMKNPENTNPAILREQLNSIASSESAGAGALPSDIAIINIDVTEENTIVLQQGDGESEM